MYRKYLEPKYGEVARYVQVDPPEKPDMPSLKAWRVKHNFEGTADLGFLMRKCNCYPAMMEVETDDIRLTRDDGGIVTVRVYQPITPGPHRVMVYYHGGGWATNNLDLYDNVPRYFARFGDILTVSVDYRLAPENKFPTGLEDAYAATVWAWEHAKEYGGDLSSFSVCGDSSGGNFASAISIMTRDRKGPKISKQILIYPATTFNLAARPASELRYGNGGYFLEVDSSKGVGTGYLSDPDVEKLNPYASPLELTDFDGIPPACFISAECDPILDHALFYAAKLEDNGVDVAYHLYEGMLHGFINRTYQKTFEAFDTIIEACPAL